MPLREREFITAFLGMERAGVIPLPPGTPEWLRPIVSIVPAQLFAYHATLARGLDPDEPRYISKVTRTT